jgi:hypothetical protein
MEGAEDFLLGGSRGSLDEAGSEDNQAASTAGASPGRRRWWILGAAAVWRSPGADGGAVDSGRPGGRGRWG